MVYTEIAYAADGPIARLSHNRPDARNAESQRLLSELDDALGRAVADDSVKVVIFDAAGEHFSAGHDLKEAAAKRADFTVEQRWAYEELYYFDCAMRI